MELTKEEETQAKLYLNHFPYYKLFFVVGNNERFFICKPTAHKANSLARKGYNVYKVK